LDSYKEKRYQMDIAIAISIALCTALMAF